MCSYPRAERGRHPAQRLEQDLWICGITMNKKNTVIRLIGAVCLAAFVLTGCFGTERHLGTYEELEQAVAQKLAGEPFECLEDDPLGRTFRTTDRNIEFEVNS